MKVQHTQGPWWYGWENFLDTDDACWKFDLVNRSRRSVK